MRSKANAGRSLIEVVLVMTLIAIVSGIAIPGGLRLADEYRLRGAAYHFRGLIRRARAQAAARSSYVGIVFDEVATDPELALYIDGNGNGIRRADIGAGIDRRITASWKLTEAFPGIGYGTPPSDGPEPPLSGIRFGRSYILSFSPTGSATSGTLYLQNEAGSLCAVTVLGATGRVRIRRYHAGRWVVMP